MEYVSKGLTVEKALQISGLTKHQYYYKKKMSHKRGRKPSTETIYVFNGNKYKHSNEEVVAKMIENHSDPDLRYGYKKMTTFLKIAGYEINHKKVYRLMCENQLLKSKSMKKRKNYAKYRIVIPSQPLEVLEMDIKLVWIESKRTHAYILTILDVFTRRVLEWHVAMSITQSTVKEVFTSVIVNHLQEYGLLEKGVHIEIRNDNDKRFSARLVQQFFKQNFLNQVFTHPYTPQENGHIESFHSILGRSLDRHDFLTLQQLEEYLIIFYEKYNNQRLHGSIANLPPNVFWEQWKLGNIQRVIYDYKKVRFKLLISYNHISGNVNQREVHRLNYPAHSGQDNLLDLVKGAFTSYQPSV